MDANPAAVGRREPGVSGSPPATSVPVCRPAGGEPYARVVNELDSTVTAYATQPAGTLAPMQIVPSLPATYTGNNTGAAIVVSPSGRFVYVSNRGHESVGILRVDESNGTLSAIGWESTPGTTPRFISLDPAGARLYAANQRSDSIVEFRVDQATGLIAATGQVVKANTPPLHRLSMR